MDYYTTMEESRTITMQSELRGYIGQLSFHLNLPFHDGDPRERFQIKVSESRDKLTVIDKVANNSEDMELPARISEHAAQYIVSEPSAAPNCISRDKKKMGFSYRLEVDQEHALALRQNSLNDDYVPWDADYMKDRGDLLCRYCDYPVAHCGYGWRWRNLPSSNWADMMDLWHCHKPHSREDQLQAAAEERSASRRGIGAGNRVVARRQAVYVDISTLLLSKDDCWTIKLERTKPVIVGDKVRVPVICKGCGKTLGEWDQGNGYRLYKASLGLQVTDSHGWLSVESHPTEEIIAAQMLECVDRENISHFIVHTGRKLGKVLWLFNKDLRYSMVSVDCTVNNRRAIKVHYRDIADAQEALRTGLIGEEYRHIPRDLEEIFVPDNLWEDLIVALKVSTEGLPHKHRKWGEWDVGYLPRYEPRRSDNS
ncbi:hypothetical protein VTN31DRAFT_3552 [Thermomyces dupontii]|uniref:uncharacterized protein n=1 Tax=Talaromyces thermophilus TaxID=28565 RepID=UPI003743F4D3